MRASELILEKQSVLILGGETYLEYIARRCHIGQYCDVCVGAWALAEKWREARLIHK